MEACKVENNTSESIFWMTVLRYEEGKYPAVNVKFLPRPCQHCDNPPCVKVCPVGARFKQEDGLVLTDFKRCIGCRYCEVACPYGVNYFNWEKPKDNYYLDWDDEEKLEPVTKGNIPPWKNPDLDKRYGPDDRLVAGGSHFKGTIEKCTFCVQRLAKGLQPACVETCPTKALHFGDLDDPQSAVSRINKKPKFHLLEEAGTEPRVFYVGGEPPESEAKPIETVKARA